MATERSARDRVAWDQIRYASVWEDAGVLTRAFAPLGPGARLLSIASAGDNALALLTLEPEQVVAVDLNPAQLACLELRVAAFRVLEPAGIAPFLGVGGDGAGRLASYRPVRAALSAGARAFWDARPELVAGGVIHAGRFERYLRAFGRRVLPLVHDRRTREALLEPRELEARREFFRRRWDTLRWRLLFRLFFSRAVMGRLGRDPALFDHVEGSVGDRILARTRHALTELPTATNPFLTYIVAGNYRPHALPLYLRPEVIPVIQRNLERLRWARGGVEAAEGSFDGFNLSDIFEYMTPAEHERVYGLLLDRARPGGRLVYWNMLAPRARPERHARRARPLRSLAEQLHRTDQAWFYSALHVDEVVR